MSDINEITLKHIYDYMERMSEKIDVNIGKLTEKTFDHDRKIEMVAYQCEDNTDYIKKVSEKIDAKDKEIQQKIDDRFTTKNVDCRNYHRLHKVIITGGSIIITILASAVVYLFKQQNTLMSDVIKEGIHASPIQTDKH